MRRCLVMLFLAVMSCSGAAADVDLTSIAAMRAEADLKAWQANEGMSLRTAESAGRTWMAMHIDRYRGEGNSWPTAALPVKPVEFLDANGVAFVIHNPLDHAQAIQVNVSDAAGQGASDIHRIPPRSTRTCISYFTEMSSMIDLSNIVSVGLYRTQPDDDQTLLVGSVEAVHDPQSPTILRELRDTHDALTDAIQTCRRKKLLPDDRLKELWALQQTWRTNLDELSQLVGRAAEARQVLGQALSQARAAVLRAETGQSLILWAGDAGRQLLPVEAIASLDQPIEQLHIDVLGNAYAHGIVRLTNVGTTTADLLASLEDASDPIRSATMFWRAGSVRAVDASVVADALIPMDPAGSLILAPGETAELWVRIDARHHDLPTGQHTASLNLRDLRDPRATTALPIIFDVSGIHLPEESPLHVLLWPELYESRSDAVRGLEVQALQNMADYGANVMTMLPNELPWPKLDASGNLVEPLDAALFDQRVRFYEQHLPGAIYLCWLRFDTPDPDGNFALRSGLEPGTDAWQHGVKTWLSAWRTHIQSLGIDPSRFVFYISDEPGTEELDRHMLFAPLAREAAPDMPVYTNASELFDDPERDAEFLALTDIIQPDATIGFERNPRLLSELQAQESLEIWVYACRTGRRARYVNPHSYYRLQSWFAMRHGLTGIGFWAYAAAHGDPNELWDGTAASASGAPLIYRGHDQLLMSRRWELIRAGIDDARLIKLLQTSGRPAASALIEAGHTGVLDRPADTQAVEKWRRQVIEALR